MSDQLETKRLPRRAPAHLTSDEVKAYNKAYYAANAERLKAKRRRNRLLNLEKERAYAKEYNKTPAAAANRKRFAEKEESTILGFLTSRHRLARSNAKSRGLCFEIEVEDLLVLWKQQAGLCSISGLSLAIGGGAPNEKASIDRIDSSIGYTPTNIRLVCWWINQAKSSGTDGELFRWCRAIVEKLPK